MITKEDILSMPPVQNLRPGQQCKVTKTVWASLDKGGFWLRLYSPISTGGIKVIGDIRFPRQ